MIRRTIEQERAEDALARVKELVNRGDNSADLGKYRSYVDRLGPAILMNGLGQALATERASSGEEHEIVYNNVSTWLCGAKGVYRGSTDLLTSIMENGEENYLLAQAEALAWLRWHKKFCRAFLRDDEGRK